MNLGPADPAPRAAAPRPRRRRRATTARPANRTPVKSRAGARPPRAPPGRLRDPRRRRRPDRDRHPDGLLVVGDEGLPSQDDDTFAIVGPQIQWAVLGHRRDGRDDAGRLPLPAARLGAALRRRHRPARPRLRARSFNIVVGGSARWLKLPLAAGDPPGRVRQARPGHLPRPLVRQARAAGSAASGAGTVPFLVIVAPIIALVFKEPDLGTTDGHRPDRVHDVLRRRREPGPPRGRWRRRRSSAIVAGRPARLPARPDPGLARPLARTRSATGFHTIQGLLALGRRRPARDRASARADAGGRSCPNAFNDFIFAEHRPGVRADRGGRRDRPVPAAGLLGHPRRARGAGHVRGAAGGRASPPGCASRRSSTSASSSRCCRSPASRCRSSAPAARRSSSASRRSGSCCRSRARPSRRGRGTTCDC